MIKAALTSAAASALFAAALPRGPQDGLTAVAVVLLALLAGAVAGRLGRGARGLWSLPPVAWLASEAVRFPYGTPLADLPPVRALRGSQYALGVIVFDRGVDLVLFLVPLAVGVWLGSRRAGRRTVATVAAGAVACASLGLLVPASTPAIAGGVAEVSVVPSHGCDQRVVVRGASATNPVVVFLSGGPGGSEIGTLRNRWSAIERDFTVVQWDQTGAGSNGRCWPRDGLTLDRIEDDGIAVLEYVHERFGTEPILVGNSWGSFLGVLLAQRRPDLVGAYVGTGQMVTLRGTDVAFYDDTLAWARTNGRPDVVAELERQGPPPYGSMYPYEEAFAHESDWNAWDRDPAVSAAVNPIANVWDKPELDPVAKARYIGNLIDSFSALYPHVQDIDFRRDVTALDVPVYLASGAHEARGRAMFVRPWFDHLVAPRKEWVDFAASGHKAFAEEPDAFLQLLRRVAG